MSTNSPQTRNSQETEYLKLLGANIRKWRENKGLTQEQFASLVGFTRSYITEIENGKRNISFLNLVKIVKSLEADEQDWRLLILEINKVRERIED